MTDLLERPLVAVAGRLSPTRTLVLWMHEGYTSLAEGYPDYLFTKNRDLPDGAFALVMGSLSNPHCSWPVYMTTRTRQEPR